MSKQVWVELSESGLPVRIFAGKVEWGAFLKNNIVQMDRAKAVSLVRSQLWKRCAGYCEKCGTPITENGPYNKSEMHEKVWRGKGGEISLDNGIMTCQSCHRVEHKSRNPRWTDETNS